MSTLSPPAAVIHDVRYSRFSGELHSRAMSVVALAQSSALRALGIRRSGGAKVWPFLLVIAAFLPAIIAVGVPLIVDSVSSPLDVLGLGDLLTATSIVLLAFAATTLPSLLTRERRDRVLALYFATALSPAEYVAGKVLAAISLVLLITFGPLLLVLLGGILTADQPVQWAQNHAGDFPKALGAALLVSVYHAAIGLGLGALTNRRVFAVGGYVALMMVPAGMGAAFAAISNNASFLAMDLLHVPFLLGNSILSGSLGEDGPPAALLWSVWAAALVLALGVLIQRYHSGRES